MIGHIKTSGEVSSHQEFLRTGYGERRAVNRTLARFMPRRLVWSRSVMNDQGLKAAMDLQRFLSDYVNLSVSCALVDVRTQ